MHLARFGRSLRNQGSRAGGNRVPHSTRRFRSPVWGILAALFLMGTAGGCYEFRDGIDDKMIARRNRTLARDAWKRSRPAYKHVDFVKDFRQGFQDGYFDVAMGGSGCQPALPPRDYWGVKYQSPEGHQQILAWFNGYSHGAFAAEQDGVALWNRIATSPVAPPYPIPDPHGPAGAHPAPPPTMLPPPPESPYLPYEPPPAPPVGSALPVETPGIAAASSPASVAARPRQTAGVNAGAAAGMPRSRNATSGMPLSAAEAAGRSAGANRAVVNQALLNQAVVNQALLNQAGVNQAGVNQASSAALPGAVEPVVPAAQSQTAQSPVGTSAPTHRPSSLEAPSAFFVDDERPLPVLQTPVRSRQPSGPMVLPVPKAPPHVNAQRRLTLQSSDPGAAASSTTTYDGWGPTRHP